MNLAKWQNINRDEQFLKGENNPKPKKRPSEEELHNYADIQTTESSKACERESKLIIISFVNCYHSQLESKSLQKAIIQSFNQLMYYLNIRPQHLLSSSACHFPQKKKTKTKKEHQSDKKNKARKTVSRKTTNHHQNISSYSSSKGKRKCFPFGVGKPFNRKILGETPAKSSSSSATSSSSLL
jgi:hypothetical protein